MNKPEIEKMEIDLFLETLNRRYGYDFRNYAKASLKRRIIKTIKENNIKHISDMIPKLIHDTIFFDSIISNFSVAVTEMFRDPSFFSSLRENVIPFLKTYPYIKIWHGGCATGEEAYSLAILLKEEGIYDKCTIFATDFNDVALSKAKGGIYNLKDIKKFTNNYQKAGGKASFSDYYIANNKFAILDNSLKKNITFANHNLVTDGVFSEIHLILCRNVLIYFNKELQNKVLKLFTNSLINKGYLAIGSKETIQFSEIENLFVNIDKTNKIYKKS